MHRASQRMVVKSFFLQTDQTITVKMQLVDSMTAYIAPLNFKENGLILSQFPGNVNSEANDVANNLSFDGTKMLMHRDVDGQNGHF